MDTKRIKISIGQSATSKEWNNQILTWNNFCEKFDLENITKRDLDIHEYLNMKTYQQKKIKDIGGYVGGHLLHGIRKSNNVLCRTLITLEIDNTLYDFNHYVEKMENQEYAYLMHTTCSHTPDNPRLRIIIPLKSEVSGKIYPFLVDYIINNLEITNEVDITCNQSNRLMYWACLLKNTEYLIKYKNSEFFDPQPIIEANPEWGILNLKEISKEALDKVEIAKKKYLQKDPREKNKIIGAFCKAYNIYDCIEKFIPDYIPTDIPVRYTYAGGTSYGGVLCFEDVFSYSFHNSDPASSRLSSAFDLVRIHKFEGDFKKALEFCVQQEGVNNFLAQEEFGEELEDWQLDLTRDKNGYVATTLTNLTLIIENSDSTFKYNEFTNQIVFFEKGKEIEAYNDLLLSKVLLYLEKEYGIYHKAKTEIAIRCVAEKNTYHPVRSYLDDLPEWDNIPRIDTLLIDYFKAEDNIYNREAIRKTLIAAVKRTYEPGCDWRTMLVLIGGQAIGKSTFFRNLCPSKKWFSDSFNLTQAKDVKITGEQLEGTWIMEIAELEGMRRSESDSVKNMISRQSDRYREAFGKGTADFPRQSIFVGTANETFLKDITGNSRYKIIHVKERTRDKLDRDQIWSEAKHYYKQGESLNFSKETLKIAQTIELENFEVDERKSIVDKYISTLVPEDWLNYTIEQRQNYFAFEQVTVEDDLVGDKKSNLKKREWISAIEVWCECFGKQPYDLDQRNSTQINKILRSLGYTKESKAFDKAYGKDNKDNKRKVYKKA
jgi:putative DNA primase/helicase